MTEFQFACLVITLISLVVLVGYLLYRTRMLQVQCDMLRHDLQRLSMRGFR